MACNSDIFTYLLYLLACNTLKHFPFSEGKPEGKRSFGRPRRRWVDNIKINLREIGWDAMDWIDVTQDRDQWRALVNTVMNLRVLKHALPPSTALEECFPYQFTYLRPSFMQSRYPIPLILLGSKNFH
jgi:hypothetical protein